MKDIVSLLKAPSSELDKFDGNPLEYEYFKATFKEAVEKMVPDQRGRHKDYPEKEIKIYAMIDNDCTICFAINEIMNTLAPTEV